MNNGDRIERLVSIAKAIGRGEIPADERNDLHTSGRYDLLVFTGDNEADILVVLVGLCAEYERFNGTKQELSGLIYVLEQAARASNTTEPPVGMERIIRENPEMTRGLQEWYRLASDS